MYNDCTCESLWTVALEGIDGVYGPQQHGVRRHKLGGIAELESGDALLKVETGLPHADVVFKG